MTKDVVKRLSKWYSGDIHDCLERLGIWGFLPGLSLYGSLPEAGRICGPATTVQFVPTRRKVRSRQYHKAIDEIGQGGVMVVDTAGASGSCTGELMATGTKVHGGVCSIVNGTIRDIEEINALDYPVFAKGVVPTTAEGHMEDIGYNVNIEIGGVRIQPGDIIFADLDGVIVIPKDAAEKVADLADELGAMERDFKSQILNGKPLYEVFGDI